MALEKAGDIVKDAYKRKACVAAFNVLNYDMIKLAIRQAESLNTPILIACYPGFKDIIAIEALAEITKLCARDVKVPIGLHLDHSTEYDVTVLAMKMGYSSVMYDGSVLPFDENVKNTAEITKVAKALNIDVEAELGQVGSAESLSDFSDSAKFTSPDDAEAFVARTGCSSLAVAVGNAHGSYVKEPALDLNRIEDISNRLKIPLVLHGGSGIPDNQVKKAIKRGIAKINVGTEYFHAYNGAVEARALANKNQKDMINAAGLVREDVLAYLEGKIKLLSS